MGERYQGRVIRIKTVGEPGDERELRLRALLDEMPGVDGYEFDVATGVLTAYVEDTDAHEASIARALEATGVYPLRATLIGGRTEGDMNVC